MTTTVVERLRACCADRAPAPLEESQAEVLAAAFRLLGDPGRLRLLGLIGDAGEEGVCTCDLVEPLGLTQPTVSHHLKLLREGGLVEARRQGRFTYYRAAPGAASSLVAGLRNLYPSA
jgi:ArsR family transcriptional regulator